MTGRRSPVLDPRELAVSFAQDLRGVGIAVPTTSVLAFVDAMTALAPIGPAQVYWAARATLVSRPEDIGLFDEMFRNLWAAGGRGSADAPEEAHEGATPDGERAIVRWSDREVLRHRDFAACGPEEIEETFRLMREARVRAALRRSRRLRRSRARHGARPDVSRALRRSLRTGGDVLQIAYRQRSRRPRRLVLLCDVSGSMELYSRALLRFLHVAVGGRGRVEAFTIGTRLTRVTRELRSHDPDAALALAARAVGDAQGGTRLGEVLRTFNDEWGVRGTARRAIVVILSDGWDQGDPALLGEQMARLSRVAHRVVWVNPLAASDGYEPVARGMAAAMPYVDELLEGHSLASLEELVEVVAA